MEFNNTQILELDESFGGETDDEKDFDDKIAIAHLISSTAGQSSNFAIFKGTNKIGRSPSCEVQILSESVSKHHCSIECIHGTHLIFDNNSTNKTKRNKVNLLPNVRYELKNEDELQFGDIRCVYKLASELKSQSKKPTKEEDGRKVEDWKTFLGVESENPHVGDDDDVHAGDDDDDVSNCESTMSHDMLVATGNIEFAAAGEDNDTTGESSKHEVSESTSPIPNAICGTSSTPKNKKILDEFSPEPFTAPNLSKILQNTSIEVEADVEPKIMLATSTPVAAKHNLFLDSSPEQSVIDETRNETNDDQIIVPDTQQQSQETPCSNRKFSSSCNVVCDTPLTDPPLRNLIDSECANESNPAFAAETQDLISNTSNRWLKRMSLERSSPERSSLVTEIPDTPEKDPFQCHSPIAVAPNLILNIQDENMEEDDVKKKLFCDDTMNSEQDVEITDVKEKLNIMGSPLPREDVITCVDDSMDCEDVDETGKDDDYECCKDDVMINDDTISPDGNNVVNETFDTTDKKLHSENSHQSDESSCENDETFKAENGVEFKKLLNQTGESETGNENGDVTISPDDNDVANKTLDAVDKKVHSENSRRFDNETFKTENEVKIKNLFDKTEESEANNENNENDSFNKSTDLLQLDSTTVFINNNGDPISDADVSGDSRSDADVSGDPISDAEDVCVREVIEDESHLNVDCISAPSKVTSKHVSQHLEDAEITNGNISKAGNYSLVIDDFKAAHEDPKNNNEQVDEVEENGQVDAVEVDKQVDAVEVDKQVDAVEVDKQVDAVEVDKQVDAVEVDKQVDAIEVNKQVDAVEIDEQVDAVEEHERNSLVFSTNKLNNSAEKPEGECINAAKMQLSNKEILHISHVDVEFHVVAADVDKESHVVTADVDKESHVVTPKPGGDDDDDGENDANLSMHQKKSPHGEIFSKCYSHRSSGRTGHTSKKPSSGRNSSGVVFMETASSNDFYKNEVFDEASMDLQNEKNYISMSENKSSKSLNRSSKSVGNKRKLFQPKEDDFELNCSAEQTKGGDAASDAKTFPFFVTESLASVSFKKKFGTKRHLSKSVCLTSRASSASSRKNVNPKKKSFRSSSNPENSYEEDNLEEKVLKEVIKKASKSVGSLESTEQVVRPVLSRSSKDKKLADPDLNLSQEKTEEKSGQNKKIERRGRKKTLKPGDGGSSVVEVGNKLLQVKVQKVESDTNVDKDVLPCSVKIERLSQEITTLEGCSNRKSRNTSTKRKSISASADQMSVDDDVIFEMMKSEREDIKLNDKSGPKLLHGKSSGRAISRESVSNTKLSEVKRSTDNFEMIKKEKKSSVVCDDKSGSENTHLSELRPTRKSTRQSVMSSVKKSGRPNIVEEIKPEEEPPSDAKEEYVNLSGRPSRNRNLRTKVSTSLIRPTENNVENDESVVKGVDDDDGLFCDDDDGVIKKRPTRTSVAARTLKSKKIPQVKNVKEEEEVETADVDDSFMLPFDADKENSKGKRIGGSKTSRNNDSKITVGKSKKRKSGDDDDDDGKDDVFALSRSSSSGKSKRRKTSATSGAYVESVESLKSTMLSNTKTNPLDDPQPRKRGRPKKSMPEDDSSRVERGRPKKSMLEDGSSRVERGRPKKSMPEDGSSHVESGQIPKIIITGVKGVEAQAMVKKLGAEEAESVFACTHVVSCQVRRTIKFMCGVARGVPIVTTDWLKLCLKEKRFIDAWDYLIKDEDNEKKFNFDLKKSLARASKKPLFQGLSFHITKNVLPEPAEMKDIIICAGGKIVDSMPRKSVSNLVVVSCTEDLKLCKNLESLEIPFVTSEFVMSGILRQQIDFEEFKLSPQLAIASSTKGNTPSSSTRRNTSASATKRNTSASNNSPTSTSKSRRMK